ncbi:MAG: hypothetical protein AB4426_18765 [Xenococcaceae cyanobacterium]
MRQKIDRRMNRGGRIFPEYTILPEELARREAENEEFLQRCQIIFDRVYPELVTQYYDWFIIIEPESGDYFIDLDHKVGFQKARQKHPKAELQAMRLNETGTCGRV